MALVDSIIGAESGGDPSARNPNSSASGAGQFLDRTWLDVVRQHRPDLAASSDADLLALKSDPVLSKAMVDAYAADNGGILSRAGLPVTPGTQYLAHFAGPGGAIGLLNADPTTPAGAILGAGVVAANPFLARMSAGDVAAWADRKMGGGTPAPLSLAGPQLTAPAAPAPPQPQVPRQAAAAPQGGTSAPASVPNYDQTPAPLAAANMVQQPAPLALIPPRPRIDLAQIYANLKRG